VTQSRGTALAGWVPSALGVMAVALGPDGRIIATGDSNSSTYLWIAATGSLMRTLYSQEGRSAGVQALAFSPDGRTLAVGNTKGFADLWHA